MNVKVINILLFNVFGFYLFAFTSCGQNRKIEHSYSWQELETFYTASPVLNQSLGGYRHKKTKEIIIPPMYSSVYEFHNGYAKVNPITNKKYGFINSKNELKIPAIYTVTRNFSEGLVAVSQEGKWGAVDTLGEVVIPLKYQALGDFSEDVAKVLGGNYKWGFVDRKGNEIVNFQYKRADRFQNGLARVQKDTKWGYIDKEGEIIIPMIYKNASNFLRNYALVSDSTYKLIDKKNKIIQELPYDYADMITDNLILVEDAQVQKTGFINSTGKIAIPFIYDGVEPYMLGQEILIQVWTNQNMGVIDTEGKIIIPLAYDEIYFMPSEQRIEAIKNNQVEFFDIHGNRID